MSTSLPEDYDRLTASLWQPLAEQMLLRGWTLATAESCTGGLIAAGCTSLAGSSRWFDRGFVTYTNESKQELLGVDPAAIDAYGAVSQAVAQAMAAGAIARSKAQVSVAVTGVAGPGGGSADKPVGTVWLAFCLPGRPPMAELRHFEGDRAAIRAATVRHARERLLGLVQGAAHR
ncbi:nicotinamide-nucleotide amidohydrolase family protein [Xylophilus sp. Kf1]|nr:nicotinamide-nucleotide amidohydrolase family protein [Xylophilus sp. Kf1]